MTENLFPVGFNNTIENELKALSLAVTEHRAALNNEGVWLFLSVLGCWSVTPPELRMAALIAAAILFWLRISSLYTDDRSFSEMLQDVRNRVEQLAATEQARQVSLDQISLWHKQHLGRAKPIRQGFQFLVGAISMAVTFIDTCRAVF